MAYKPSRKANKSSRARELIASIYNIPIGEVRSDRMGVLTMYENLEGLGFEWVADAQEWLNPSGKNPADVSVFSLVIGSSTHKAEEAALIVIEGLEALGYKLRAAAVIKDMGHPEETIVRVEVIK